MDKKNKFLKLKQLDRIEYLLERERLEKNQTYLTLPFINSMIYILLFAILFAVLMLGFFKSFAIISIFPLLVMIIKVGLVVAVVVDIIQFYHFYLKRKELNKRFKL